MKGSQMTKLNKLKVWQPKWYRCWNVNIWF